MELATEYYREGGGGVAQAIEEVRSFSLHCVRKSLRSESMWLQRPEIFADCTIAAMEAGDVFLWDVRTAAQRSLPCRSVLR